MFHKKYNRLIISKYLSRFYVFHNTMQGLSQEALTHALPGPVPLVQNTNKQESSVVERTGGAQTKIFASKFVTLAVMYAMKILLDIYKQDR